MKKIAFTLMEVLMAMSIIGIIAAATTNSIKNVSTNRTKLTFQNAYNHLTQTVAGIVSDENIYPNVVSLTRIDPTGHAARSTMCELNVDFINAFRDATKYIPNTVTGVDKGIGFDTPSGVYWVVRRQKDSCQATNSNNINKSSDADYMILFDINGPGEGTNCPYNISNPTASPASCNNPDTFMFAVNCNNDIIPYNDGTQIYNGNYLLQFMNANNYLQTK